jgi:hypothetical protein
VAPTLLPAAEAMQRRSTSKFRRRSADKPILTRAQYEAKLARERREKVYILARAEALAEELAEIKTALASELAGQGAEAFTATAAAPSAADARLEASCLALIPAAAAESAERCAGLNGAVTPKIQE